MYFDLMTAHKLTVKINNTFFMQLSIIYSLHGEYQIKIVLYKKNTQNYSILCISTQKTSVQMLRCWTKVQVIRGKTKSL